jgi:hypothetical protein
VAQRLLGIVGLLLMGAARPCLADADDLAKSLVDADRQAIAAVAKAFPPAGTADAWLRTLAKQDADEPRDLGFGATRREVRVAGGYANVDVCALVRGTRLVEVDVRCAVDREPLARALADAWGSLPVRRDTKGFRHRWSDPALRAEQRAEIERALGPRPEGPVPAEAQAAFDLLDDPLEPLVYGRMFGDDGAPPPGRDALEALVRAKAAPALRSLLRSANPEGRVYAVEGLRRLEKDGVAIPDADAKAVAAIESSPLLVECCVGCEVFTRKAKPALDDEAARAKATGGEHDAGRDGASGR